MLTLFEAKTIVNTGDLKTMKKLTKKYVRENCTISKVYTTNGSTLEGCRFQMSEELQNRDDDKLFNNMLKWGWIRDIGRFVITWEGMRNLEMV
jgi:hypothetical protein